MKTLLSLSLIVAGASTLVACSSDEGTPRGQAGTGTIAGAGGQASNAGAAGAPGTAGTTAAGAGGSAGAASSNLNYGAPLVITADGNVVDEAGDTNINGGAVLAQSAQMAVAATVSHRDGALCFSGTTEVVPDANSYGDYWGAELSLDLNRVAVPGAEEAVADAGADAGPVLGTVAQPWPYGNVIGFSYKVEGQDAAAADKGVPPAQFRFKGLPQGSDGQNDTYCTNRALVDQATDNVLFSDISFECWVPGNSTLADDTIQRVDPGPPRVVETPVNPRALLNVAWQIASDIAPVAQIPFNFCITELRPILATP